MSLAALGDNPLLTSFHTPPITSRPYIRWWWPHGLVDPPEIRNEVNQIADAGFGGIEIQDVHHSIDSDEYADELEADTHGWGTGPWVDAVKAALEESKARGLAHDMAFGPAWPMGVSTITPDDEAASKELILGQEFTTGAYDGPVPAPFAEAAEEVTETLLAVQAWRVVDAEANPVLLERGSRVDLTPDVVEGHISFTPPEGQEEETWLIFSAVVRGSAQQPESGPHTDPTTYVVDHFSTTGLQVVLDYWEENLLSDVELESLLASATTTFMEDSIEITSPTYWTPAFPEEFLARRGYDIVSILPIVSQYDEEEYAFHFAEDETEGAANYSRAALNDYWETLTDLFVENHIQPVRTWLHDRLNASYRLQPYGIPEFNGMRAASETDIPEGESLGFRVLDNYRGLVGAANLVGLPKVSNELGAYKEHAYATTWREILATVNPQLVAGVTQNVLHGFSYATAPGATWPGFAAFTPYYGKIGYAESWGPRHPTWLHAVDFTSYLGRVQYVLQQGRAKYDVAFLRQSGAVDANYVCPYFTGEGAQVGWTTSFVDPALLSLPAAKVGDNGRFAPEAGDYGLIFLEADPFRDGSTLMTVELVNTLLGYAEAGLPILMTGEWSSPQSWSMNTTEETEDTLSTKVEALLANDNVAHVQGVDEIPSALETLGLSPAVQYESSPLIYTRRADGEIDNYFFVANSSSDGVDTTVSVPLRDENSVPVQLDPWTGNASILPLYSISDGVLHFPITLEPYQSSLITIMPTTNTTLHAVDSTAPSLSRDSAGRIYVISPEAGTYTTTLSNGQKHTTTFTTDQATISLSEWTLEVDEWQPDTSADDITATQFIHHTLELSALDPWTAISELEDVSGNATYTTTFSLDMRNGTTGAYLELDPFSGSFRISVNGHGLSAPDQMATRFDISRWLRNGVNEVAVELATSLLNVMKVVQPDIYTIDKQEFGLVGARIVPFHREYVS